MGQPYTINFGPWTPDLQNVGVQMPYQWSATPLPVADCLNVYWQDGAYRNLPGPVAVGPTLGVPITNAVNWYDDSTGIEEIFAATANGIYMLADGVWSAVPVTISSQANAIGQLLQITLGVPLYASYAVAPVSQTDSGTASSFTFSAEVVSALGSIGVTGYNWTFNAGTGPGTWNLLSGQGTDSAAASVTGVPSGTTATVNLTCAVTINGTVYSVAALLSYQNVFAPTAHLYTNQGAMTETIPAGASNVVIEVWGGGGGGGAQYQIPGEGGSGGGGGGSGAYSRSGYALTSANWGQTMAVSSTAAATNVTVASGTYSVATMTGNAGVAGTAAAGVSTPGVGGAGGAASGGNVVDTSGNAGTNGDTSQNGGNGGAALAGINAGPYGAGGGGQPNGTGTQGAGGANFYYT